MAPVQVGRAACLDVGHPIFHQDVRQPTLQDSTERDCMARYPVGFSQLCLGISSQVSFHSGDSNKLMSVLAVQN